MWHGLPAFLAPFVGSILDARGYWLEYPAEVGVLVTLRLHGRLFRIGQQAPLPRDECMNLLSQCFEHPPEVLADIMSVAPGLRTNKGPCWFLPHFLQKPMDAMAYSANSDYHVNWRSDMIMFMKEDCAMEIATRRMVRYGEDEYLVADRNGRVFLRTIATEGLLRYTDYSIKDIVCQLFSCIAYNPFRALKHNAMSNSVVIMPRRAGQAVRDRFARLPRISQLQVVLAVLARAIHDTDDSSKWDAVKEVFDACEQAVKAGCKLEPIILDKSSKLLRLHKWILDGHCHRSLIPATLVANIHEIALSLEDPSRSVAYPTIILRSDSTRRPIWEDVDEAIACYSTQS